MADRRDGPDATRGRSRGRDISLAEQGRAPAVEVEDLSKCYRVSARPRLSALRSDEGDGPATGPDPGFDEPEDDEFDAEPEEEPRPVGRPREIWALQDVSFTVAPGTALGIVGSNGAGKSTLLRVLGRSSPPTAGRAVVRGKVVPLLEVAAQLLVPDLTVRQNVLLLARLLGSSEEVAERNLSAILAFAELVQYEEMDLHRCSKGALARLAFSTMLNLEPDVLLADQSVGAGDREFRKRCVTRIEELSGSGTTVLLVSHDLRVVRRICSEAIWLDAGRIVSMGAAEEVVSRYEAASAGADLSAQDVGEREAAEGRKARRSRRARRNVRVERTDRRNMRKSVGRSADGREDELAPATGHNLPRRAITIPAVRVVYAGGTTVSVWVDIRRAECRLICVVILTDAGGESVRIVTGKPMEIDGAGRYLVRAVLPPGMVPMGRYVGRVRVVISGNGPKRSATKGSAFVLDVPEAGVTVPDAEVAWSVDPWREGASVSG